MRDSVPLLNSSNPNYNPLLVNARTAAGMLAVSLRTLWTMTRNGQLAHVKIGARGIRYSVEALKAWIASGSKGGRP